MHYCLDKYANNERFKGGRKRHTIDNYLKQIRHIQFLKDFLKTIFPITLFKITFK